MVPQKIKLKNLLINLWNNVSLKRRRDLSVLIILIFFSSIAEVISLGTVIPFLGVLTNPDKIYNLKLLVLSKKAYLSCQSFHRHKIATDLLSQQHCL